MFYGDLMQKLKQWITDWLFSDYKLACNNSIQTSLRAIQEDYQKKMAMLHQAISPEEQAAYFRESREQEKDKMRLLEMQVQALDLIATRLIR